MDKELASLNRCVDPPFLIERVEDYYDRILIQDCKRRHPLHGAEPADSAIFVRSNDYLCLANHRHIVDAEVQCLLNVGHGDSVSRVWSHHRLDSTREFEHRLARLMHAEDSVVCSSGYTANVGLIQAIAAPNTPVYLDMKAHKSLWEGVSSAKAIGRAFRHNCADHLHRMITQHGAGFIVVDALYSTDGALCALADFVDVAERTGSVLIVDETHSFGTQGPDGAGLTVARGLAERVHFRTLGLSKAVASRGGAIVCSRRNAEYIRYQAFPAIFSTSVLPHEIAGYNAALDVFAREPWRRQQLHANYAYLRRQIAALGYNIERSDAQIIALEPGETDDLFLLRDALESRGVFGSVFYPPATAERRCLIRFTLNCGLDTAALDRIVAVCAEIRDEVRMSQWRSTQRSRVSTDADGDLEQALVDLARIARGEPNATNANAAAHAAIESAQRAADRMLKR